MLDPTWYIFRLYISLPRADPICARSLRKQELLNGLNRKEPCGSVSFQRIFLLFCRPTYFCDHTSQAGREHRGILIRGSFPSLDRGNSGFITHTKRLFFCVHLTIVLRPSLIVWKRYLSVEAACI